jgi:hypothetical protein
LARSHIEAVYWDWLSNKKTADEIYSISSSLANFLWFGGIARILHSKKNSVNRLFRNRIWEKECC